MISSEFTEVYSQSAFMNWMKPVSVNLSGYIENSGVGG